MDSDSIAPLLQKLCELQQQQLEKLSEISERLSGVLAESRRNSEAYDQSSIAYRESAARLARAGTIRGVIVVAMLALIAISILISRFR